MSQENTTEEVVESKIVNAQSPSIEQALPTQHVEQVKQDGGILSEAGDRAAKLASKAEIEAILGRKQHAYGGPQETFASTETEVAPKRGGWSIR